MRAILIGATGLTGGLLLNQLLNSPVFSKIQSVSRRPVGIQHLKLQETVINFDDDIAFKNAIVNADVLFCCIGTTQQKEKGNQDSYRKIDYDIPVKAATFFAAQCSGSYVLMSSVGANAASGNFYLRLKGETENAVLQKNMTSIYIMRPSILLGDRKDQRIGESLAKVIMPAFSFLLTGSASKYKAIHAENVAKAMMNAAIIQREGKYICEYKEIMELAKQS
ncbi:MAG: NAD(P)H-binding protein [Chitinophagaceae bacterium]